ncbi:hypothetical protein K1719_010324 [Acacia pycnantha]|nr:hypothetical protein K1719_010324 [Acacia pycnantha]
MMDGEHAKEAKEAAPQPSEEELRSTKKVRIRPEVLNAGSGEGLKETDTVMAEPVASVGGSYRSKLLNGAQKGGDNQKHSEVNLTEKDYKVDKEGDIPCIDFSSEIRAFLAKGMERSLIIKLLGRSIIYHELVARTQMMWKLKGSFQLVDMEGGYYCATFDLEEDYFKVLTGGPWMIYGAYLTTQPWALDFDSKTAVVSNVVAWIRIPGLSFRYYHKSTLRAIGALLGEVVKIDYMTETRSRGRYARLAVIIDLLKPLVPSIKVDGKSYGVEYEGLPHICFTCGKHGHSKERCGVNMKPIGEDRPKGNSLATESPTTGSHGLENGKQPIDGEVAVESSPYGSWMVAKYSKKGKNHYRGKEADVGGLEMIGGSRFNVLFESEEMPPMTMQEGMGESALSVDRNGRKVGNLSINKGKALGMKHAVGVNTRPKIQSDGVKSGSQKQLQVYRPKKVAAAPEDTKNGKKQIECSDSGINICAVGGSGISPSVDPTPVRKIVQHVAPEEDKKQDLVQSNTTLIPIKISSSLNEDNHTVMFLHQSRQALDELNSLTNNSRPNSESQDTGKGDAWPGKEIEAEEELQKRQGSHGTTGGAASANSSFVNRIQGLLNRDWRVTVIHVYREGNKCADFLATYALKPIEGIHFLQNHLRP